MKNAFIFAKERRIMSTKEFTDLDRAKGASNYMYYANIPTFLKCQHDVPQNADIG
jgi:hypothetical protein